MLVSNQKTVVFFKEWILPRSCLLFLGPGSHDDRVKELKSLLQPSPSAIATLKISMFCLQNLSPLVLCVCLGPSPMKCFLQRLTYQNHHTTHPPTKHYAYSGQACISRGSGWWGTDTRWWRWGYGRWWWWWSRIWWRWQQQWGGLKTGYKNSFCLK